MMQLNREYSGERGRELIIFRSFDSLGSKGVIDYKTEKALSHRDDTTAEPMRTKRIIPSPPSETNRK